MSFPMDASVAGVLIEVSIVSKTDVGWQDTRYLWVDGTIVLNTRGWISWLLENYFFSLLTQRAGEKTSLLNFRWLFAPRACRDIPQLTILFGLDSGGPELFFFMILLGLCDITSWVGEKRAEEKSVKPLYYEKEAKWEPPTMNAWLYFYKYFHVGIVQMVHTERIHCIKSFDAKKWCDCCSYPSG